MTKNSNHMIYLSIDTRKNIYNYIHIVIEKKSQGVFQWVNYELLGKFVRHWH